jgi:hypothetical protein
MLPRALNGSRIGGAPARKGAPLHRIRDTEAQ